VTMVIHASKFSPKWKTDAPLCRIFAMSRPRGARITQDPAQISCKACRKALDLPSLAFKIPEGAHSAKALATIAQMGTKPEQWKLAEIEWVREKCMVPGSITCPDCNGWKMVLRDEAGVLILPLPVIPYGEPGCHEREADRADHFRLARSRGVACERCKGRNPRRHDYGYSTGQISALVEAEMLVGYPVWPEGVIFDSRFSGNDCQLCAKRIPSGGVVPVHTVGEGTPHGMWVGADCGAKIFGIEMKLKADQKIARK
jgi:hypothetical protein